MEGFETWLKVHGPFARDIVGDLDIAHLTAPEVLSDDVISVDITKMGLAPARMSGMIPYRSPRCKSPTAFGSTKQWRAQTALTTPLAR